jgi:hypothetical protein
MHPTANPSPGGHSLPNREGRTSGTRSQALSRLIPLPLTCKNIPDGYFYLYTTPTPPETPANCTQQRGSTHRINFDSVYIYLHVPTLPESPPAHPALLSGMYGI